MWLIYDVLIFLFWMAMTTMILLQVIYHYAIQVAIYVWENLLQDTVILCRLPKHTAQLCLCQNTPHCQKRKVWQCGVFWQMCHKIVMVPGKDTIEQCVSANAKK
jgi:hypothetical protein